MPPVARGRRDGDRGNFGNINTVPSPPHCLHCIVVPIGCEWHRMRLEHEVSGTVPVIDSTAAPRTAQCCRTLTCVIAELTEGDSQSEHSVTLTASSNASSPGWYSGPAKHCMALNRDLGWVGGCQEHLLISHGASGGSNIPSMPDAPRSRASGRHPSTWAQWAFPDCPFLSSQAARLTVADERERLSWGSNTVSQVQRSSPRGTPSPRILTCRAATTRRHLLSLPLSSHPSLQRQSSSRHALDYDWLFTGTVLTS